MSNEERKVRPDASIEDIMALMEYNKATAEAMQEGIQKRIKEGKNLAATAVAFHGDQHLKDVLDK